jgi:hypothetical protein
METRQRDTHVRVFLEQPTTNVNALDGGGGQRGAILGSVLVSWILHAANEEIRLVIGRLDRQWSVSTLHPQPRMHVDCRWATASSTFEASASSV